MDKKIKWEKPILRDLNEVIKKKMSQGQSECLSTGYSYSYLTCPTGPSGAPL